MRRGRPNEQLRKDTTQGRVWRIVCIFTKKKDYSLTAREIARMADCSLGAVAKTLAWKGYAKAAGGHRTDRSAVLRRGRPSERRRKDTAEGRVWQIVCRFTEKMDYSLTAREIARMADRSLAAVGKTLAWKGYAKAKKEQAAANKAELSERLRHRG